MTLMNEKVEFGPPKLHRSNIPDKYQRESSKHFQTVVTYICPGHVNYYVSKSTIESVSIVSMKCIINQLRLRKSHGCTTCEIYGKGEAAQLPG